MTISRTCAVASLGADDYDALSTPHRPSDERWGGHGHSTIRNVRLEVAVKSGAKSSGRSRTPVIAADVRTVPWDDRAEQAVLGAIFLDNSRLAEVHFLRPEHFYVGPHARIFEACMQLVKEGSAADNVTVATWLRTHGRLQEVGGPGALTMLLLAPPDPRNLRRYAESVYEHWRRRELIRACQLGEAHGYQPGGTATAIVHQMTAAIKGIHDSDLASLEGRTAVCGWKRLLTPAPPDWFTDPPNRRRWSLLDGELRQNEDGALPRSKVGALFAAGGAGKTMCLFQLAIAIATGTPWLGRFAVPGEGKGRVLMLLGEEDAEEARRRLYKASRRLKTMPPEDSIVVIPLAGHPCALIEADVNKNPRPTEFLAWLLEYVRTEGFAMIIVDPLSRFAGLEAETDNAVGTYFVTQLEALAAAADATVIVSHHTAKAFRGNGVDVTGASGRGSSAIFDGVRWVGTLSTTDLSKKLDDADRERMGHLVTFTCAKNNYAPIGQPIELRRGEGGTLVPLSDADAQTLARVRDGSDDRATKLRTKDQERMARETSRAAAEFERKRERERQKRESQDEKLLGAAAALVEVLLSHPDGVGARELRGELTAKLGSLSNGYDGAILAALGRAVRTSEGPRNSKLHHLVIDQIPDAVRARLPQGVLNPPAVG